MTSKRTFIVLLLSLATALVLSACSKQPAPESQPASTPPVASAPAEAPAPTPAAMPVTVASVDLGSTLGADQKVTAPETTFAPQDTIYASVATTGTGTATLDAKWTYQDGQTVKEDSKSIAPTGPATTTFSISKPDGWPAGDYHVAISLDGAQVASKDFSVK